MKIIRESSLTVLMIIVLCIVLISGCTSIQDSQNIDEREQAFTDSNNESEKQQIDSKNEISTNIPSDAKPEAITDSGLKVLKTFGPFELPEYKQFGKLEGQSESFSVLVENQSFDITVGINAARTVGMSIQTRPFIEKSTVYFTVILRDNNGNIIFSEKDNETEIYYYKILIYSPFQNIEMKHFKSSKHEDLQNAKTWEITVYCGKGEFKL